MYSFSQLRSLLFKCSSIHFKNVAVADPRYTWELGANHKDGTPTYTFSQFPQKLYENERIRPGTSLAPTWIHQWIGHQNFGFQGKFSAGNLSIRNTSLWKIHFSTYHCNNINIIIYMVSWYVTFVSSEHCRKGQTHILAKYCYNSNGLLKLTAHW